VLTRERGSVLILMPAAVLIVLTLAAITMDLSLVHLGRRELVAAVEASANDAATYGLDEGAYRRGSGYAIDPARAHRAVVQSLHARGVLDDLVQPPTILIGGTTIEVSLSMQVDYVFARALPGGPHHTTVSATGSATAVPR